MRDKYEKVLSLCLTPKYNAANEEMKMFLLKTCPGKQGKRLGGSRRYQTSTKQMYSHILDPKKSEDSEECGEKGAIDEKSPETEIEENSNDEVTEQSEETEETSLKQVYARQEESSSIDSNLQTPEDSAKHVEQKPERKALKECEPPVHPNGSEGNKLNVVKADADESKGDIWMVKMMGSSCIDFVVLTDVPKGQENIWFEGKNKAMNVCTPLICLQTSAGPRSRAPVDNQCTGRGEKKDVEKSEKANRGAKINPEWKKRKCDWENANIALRGKNALSEPSGKGDTKTAEVWAEVEEKVDFSTKEDNYLCKRSGEWDLTEETPCDEVEEKDDSSTEKGKDLARPNRKKRATKKSKRKKKTILEAPPKNVANVVVATKLSIREHQMKNQAKLRRRKRCRKGKTNKKYENQTDSKEKNRRKRPGKCLRHCRRKQRRYKRYRLYTPRRFVRNHRSFGRKRSGGGGGKRQLSDQRKFNTWQEDGMALFRRSCTGFKVRRCPSDSGSDSGRPPGERGFNGQHPNSGRSNRGAGKDHDGASSREDPEEMNERTRQRYDNKSEGNETQLEHLDGGRPTMILSSPGGPCGVGGRVKKPKAGPDKRKMLIGHSAFSDGESVHQICLLQQIDGLSSQVRKVYEEFNKCLIKCLKKEQVSECPSCSLLMLRLKHAGRCSLLKQEECSICRVIANLIKYHTLSCIDGNRAVAEAVHCDLTICCALRKRVKDARNCVTRQGFEDLWRNVKVWQRIKTALHFMNQSFAKPENEPVVFASLSLWGVDRKSFGFNVPAQRKLSSTVPNTSTLEAGALLHQQPLVANHSIQAGLSQSLVHNISGGHPQPMVGLQNIQGGLSQPVVYGGLPQPGVALQNVQGGHSQPITSGNNIQVGYPQPMVSGYNIQGGFPVPQPMVALQNIQGGQSQPMVSAYNVQGGLPQPLAAPHNIQGGHVQPMVSLQNIQSAHSSFHSQTYLSSSSTSTRSSNSFRQIPGRRMVYGTREELIAKAREWQMLKDSNGSQKGTEIEEGVILHACKGKLQIFEPGGRYRKKFEWHVATPLGAGMFGHCYMAVDDKTFEQFCLKEVPLHKYEVSEIEVLSSINHPYICGCYGAFLFEQSVYIILEFVQGCSLRQHIEAHGHLNPLTAMVFFKKLLEVLIVLKKNHIIHEDIKSENIQLRSGTADLVLVDFGLACRFTAESPQVPKDEPPVGAQTQWSPEKAMCKGYKYEADLWAAACVLNEMISGYPPWVQRFPLASKLMYVIAMQSPPLQDIASHTPPDIVHLITWLWKINVSERPACEEVFNHRAFRIDEGGVQRVIATRRVLTSGSTKPWVEVNHWPTTTFSGPNNDNFPPTEAQMEDIPSDIRSGSPKSLLENVRQTLTMSDRRKEEEVIEYGSGTGPLAEENILASSSSSPSSGRDGHRRIPPPLGWLSPGQTVVTVVEQTAGVETPPANTRPVPVQPLLIPANISTGLGSNPYGPSEDSRESSGLSVDLAALQKELAGKECPCSDDELDVKVMCRPGGLPRNEPIDIENPGDLAHERMASQPTSSPVSREIDVQDEFERMQQELLDEQIQANPHEGKVASLSGWNEDITNPHHYPANEVPHDVENPGLPSGTGPGVSNPSDGPRVMNGPRVVFLDGKDGSVICRIPICLGRDKWRDIILPAITTVVRIYTSFKVTLPNSQPPPLGEYIRMSTGETNEAHLVVSQATTTEDWYVNTTGITYQENHDSQYSPEQFQ